MILLGSCQDSNSLGLPYSLEGLELLKGLLAQGCQAITYRRENPLAYGYRTFMGCARTDKNRQELGIAQYRFALRHHLFARLVRIRLILNGHIPSRAIMLSHSMF